MSKDKFFDEFLDRIKSIHSAKEQDYTGDNPPDYNFRFSHDFASKFPSSIDKPYAYLIGTKLARLQVLLSKELVQPKNESIEDTFLDIAVYFLLWASSRKKYGEGQGVGLKDLNTVIDYYLIPKPITGEHIAKPYGCPKCTMEFVTLMMYQQHYQVCHFNPNENLR